MATKDKSSRRGGPSGDEERLADARATATRRVARYYDRASFAPGADAVAGAGLVWYMGRDHLSPSLDDRDEIALDSDRWREGASRRCLSLARRLLDHAPQRNDGPARLLDLGSGIGGAARDLEAAFGCRVISLNLSLTQLVSSRTLSRSHMPAAPLATRLLRGDAQALPLAAASVDGVYAINSLYHVADPRRVIEEAARILRPSGCLGIDDWILTEQAGPDLHDTLRHEWSSPAGFHQIDALRDHLESAGLERLEEVDFTAEAGRFLSEDRFGRTFDRDVRPRLLEAFPRLYQYPEYVPSHAAQAADQLRAAALLMGRLYREGNAVYRQLLARKAPA